MLLVEHASAMGWLLEFVRDGRGGPGRSLMRARDSEWHRVRTAWASDSLFCLGARYIPARVVRARIGGILGVFAKRASKSMGESGGLSLRFG